MERKNILVLFGHGNKAGLMRMLKGISEEVSLGGISFFYAIDYAEDDFMLRHGFEEEKIVKVKGLKKSNQFFTRILGKNCRQHLLEICKARDIQLVVSYTLSTLPVAEMISKKACVPCVVWLHNHYTDTQRRYKKFLLDKCANIITVSEFIMKGVINYLGETNKGLFVAHNAINIKNFIEQADQLESPKELSGIDKTEIVIGMIAVLDRNKNPQLVLRAIAKVRESLPDKKIRVLLVGRFPEKKYEMETIELVKQLGLHDQVSFMGFQRNVSAIYRSLDIFVTPSYRDACPLAPMEAMAWSKVVVASKTGGVPEIVDDGVTGFLCETGSLDDLSNSLLRLVKDEDLRIKMGANGRKRLEELFSIPILADRIDSIFSEIIEN